MHCSPPTYEILRPTAVPRQAAERTHRPDDQPDPTDPNSPDALPLSQHVALTRDAPARVAPHAPQTHTSLSVMHADRLSHPNSANGPRTVFWPPQPARTAQTKRAPPRDRQASEPLRAHPHTRTPVTRARAAPHDSHEPHS